jgi:hypothetical protein
MRSDYLVVLKFFLIALAIAAPILIAVLTAYALLRHAGYTGK